MKQHGFELCMMHSNYRSTISLMVLVKNVVQLPPIPLLVLVTHLLQTTRKSWRARCGISTTP
uniref:Uncharacterized protein n=1 Tax=Arundo donax TaxID=35708 RepID=A0A0A9MYF4_ARUDO